MTDTQWNQLEKIIEILKLPYDATLEMQREEFTLSDFYATWMKLTLKLSKYNTEILASNLKKSMKDYENKYHLLNNPLMSSALFLDPRYQVIFL